MLRIYIPSGEFWNEKKEEFIILPSAVLDLEHSLVSISKWESKKHVPFLGKELPKGSEFIEYIKCMTLNPDIDDEVYTRLTKTHINDILKYINDPMTATTINEHGQSTRRNSEIVTSELIYYWMVALEIPFECENWPINRLITLIRICSIKNQPDKKMSKRSIMQQNTALNAARRQKMKSRG